MRRATTTTGVDPACAARRSPTSSAATATTGRSLRRKDGHVRDLRGLRYLCRLLGRARTRIPRPRPGHRQQRRPAARQARRRTGLSAPGRRRRRSSTSRPRTCTSGGSRTSTTTCRKPRRSATPDARRARSAEREFLVRELSRAVGLGGRDRRAGSASERARASVTQAVRHAMARITEHHPSSANTWTEPSAPARTASTCRTRAPLPPGRPSERVALRAHDGCRFPVMTNLPSFDELTGGDGTPAGSSWGLWGESDTLGTLNLLTAERTKRGAACVKKGSVFAINLDMHLPDPPLFGREAFTARRRLAAERGRTRRAPVRMEHAVVVAMGRLPPHQASRPRLLQRRRGRGPRHPFLGEERHRRTRRARRRRALPRVAGRAIVPNSSDPIEADDITGALAAQGVEVEPGDVLLIRTGWLSWYRAQDDAGRRAYNDAGHPTTGFVRARRTGRCCGTCTSRRLAPTTRPSRCGRPPRSRRRTR